jgi:hypothetical protein
MQDVTLKSAGEILQASGAEIDAEFLTHAALTRLKTESGGSLGYTENALYQP